MEEKSITKSVAHPWSKNGFISKDYFEIIDCGNLHLTFDSDIFRPKGRVVYQLIYVIDGICHLVIKNKTINVTKGNVVLFRPNEVQNYYYLKSEHPHTYWVHFSGFECKNIFRDCNLTNVNIVRLKRTTEIEYLLGKLCYYYHLGGPSFGTVCNGLLIAVLGLLGNSSTHIQDSMPIQIKNSSISNKNRELISTIVSRIKNDYIIKMNVSDCAKYCNMSPAHFTRKFKEIMGITPQEFIIKTKMERAQQILVYTDKSIADTAFEVGYDDTNYFSRLFKKQFHITPTQYRKMINK